MSDTDHTSDPMSNDVLDELVSLLAAATAGQWWYGTPDDTTQTVAEWRATCSPGVDDVDLTTLVLEELRQEADAITAAGLNRVVLALLDLRKEL